MSDKLFSLKNKTALVTGGARGIGRACSAALANAGARLAIVDMDEVAGRKVAAAFQARGCDAIFVPAPGCVHRPR